MDLFHLVHKFLLHTKRTTLIVLFSCVLCNFSGICQYTDVISADRPGQCFSSATPGRGIIIWQSGFQLQRFNYDPGFTNDFTWNNMLRLGLAERIEINIDGTLDEERDRFGNGQSDHKEGFSDIRTGFRFNLIPEARGLIPSMAFMAQCRFPHFESKPYSIQHVAPIFTFMTHHQVIDALSFNTNFSVNFNGNSPRPYYGYVTSLALSLGKTTVFGDFYGQVYPEYHARYMYVDGGFAIVTGKNLQLDLYGGYARNYNIGYYFVNTGFSWRITDRD